MVPHYYCHKAVVCVSSKVPQSCISRAKYRDRRLLHSQSSSYRIDTFYLLFSSTQLSHSNERPKFQNQRLPNALAKPIHSCRVLDFTKSPVQPSLFLSPLLGLVTENSADQRLSHPFPPVVVVVEAVVLAFAGDVFIGLCGLVALDVFAAGSKCR